MMLQLPVRFTGDHVQESAFTALRIDPEKTGFVLIDCDGDCGPACNAVIASRIAPALAACRSVGIRPIYLYNRPWPDGSQDVVHELHYKRRGRPSRSGVPAPAMPRWADSIKPRQGDLVIGKRGQSGFIGTDLDQSLRDRGIDTLLAVGFSFKSCLFYTLVNAFQYNFRVVFLRDGTDPQGTNEFPDTKDDAVPDGGWVRLVLTRLIEDHLGYSSTCREVADACNGAGSLPVR